MIAKELQFKLRPPLGAEHDWRAFFLGSPTFEFGVCDRVASCLEGFNRNQGQEFWMNVREVSVNEPHDVYLELYGTTEFPEYVVRTRRGPSASWDTFFAHPSADRFVYATFPGQEKVYLRIILTPIE